MKKIWKVLIIFEITILILFFGGWFVYEGKWLKEKYLEDYNNYNYGIYQPVISQVNLSTGCIYNFGVEINPEKIANINDRVNKIPN